MVLFRCWLGARRPRNLSDAARGLPRSAWPTVIHAPWSQGQMEACRAGCACGVVRCIRLCIPGYSATRCVCRCRVRQQRGAPLRLPIDD